MSKARELAELIGNAGGTSEQVLSGRRNLIINGAMQVAQRGTSFSSSGYTLDRWFMATNGTMSVTQTWSSDLGMYYFDASNTVNWGVYQKVEDKNCKHLKVGDVVTVSFYTNSSMHLGFGVSGVFTDNYTMTVIETIGSWVRQSVSITMDSTLVNGIQAGNPLYVEAKPDTAGSFAFTGVQLELGSVATPFEHRSYGEELALCQRYFERWTYDSAFEFYYSNYTGAGSHDMTITNGSFAVTKRVDPSFYWSGSIVQSNISGGVPYINSATSETCPALYTASAGSGRLYMYNNSTLYLDFDAEL